MVVTCTISAAAVMGLMWEERRREEFEDTVDGSLGEWMARARTVAVVVTTRYFVRLLSNVLNKAKILRMRCLKKEKRQEIPNTKVPELLRPRHHLREK